MPATPWSSPVTVLRYPLLAEHGDQPRGRAKISGRNLLRRPAGEPRQHDLPVEQEHSAVLRARARTGGGGEVGRLQEVGALVQHVDHRHPSST